MYIRFRPRTIRMFAVPLAVLLVAFSACRSGERDGQPATDTRAEDALEDSRVDAEAEGLLPVVEDGLWGYVDHSGERVIPPQFDHAWRFEEGLALVRDAGRFGFIRPDGSFAIEPRFTDAWHFTGELAPVEIDSAWAFVNREGEVVADTQFGLGASALVESGRPAPPLQLSATNGLYGYETAGGEYVIDPQFENAWRFFDGLARVTRDGKWGYIDRDGEFVIEAQFDQAWDFRDGVAMVQIDGGIGYIDRQGNYIWEPRR